MACCFGLLGFAISRNPSKGKPDETPHSNLESQVSSPKQQAIVPQSSPKSKDSSLARMPRTSQNCPERSGMSGNYSLEDGAAQERRPKEYQRQLGAHDDLLRFPLHGPPEGCSKITKT